jgi:CspA family cold shock protein
MATTERGVVVKFDAVKGFGFIQRPNQSPTDKNLFFHVSKNPQGKTAGVGDEVEYEVGDGAKGPEARNLTVVAKAQNPTTSASTQTPVATQPPAKPPDPEPLDATVDFMFSDPRHSENKFELEGAVFVSDSNGQPLKGAQVVIRTQYGELDTKPCTRDNGEAVFFLEIHRPYDDAKGGFIGDPLNIDHVAISASIHFGGKTLIVNEPWPRQKMKAVAPSSKPPRTPAPLRPAPASTAVTTAANVVATNTASPAASPSSVPPPLQASAAPDPTPPPSAPDNLVVDISPFPNINGDFLVTVMTRHGNDPVTGNFKIESDCKLIVKNTDGNLVKAAYSIPLQTENDGTLTFLLGFDAIQIQANFKLSAGFKTLKLVVKPPKPPAKK